MLVLKCSLKQCQMLLIRLLQISLKACVKNYDEGKAYSNDQPLDSDGSKFSPTS
jgi:hypothetical protein